MNDDYQSMVIMGLEEHIVDLKAERDEWIARWQAVVDSNKRIIGQDIDLKAERDNAIGAYETCASICADKIIERDLAVKAVAESSVVESKLREERDRYIGALKIITKLPTVKQCNEMAEKALEASDEQ